MQTSGGFRTRDFWTGGARFAVMCPTEAIKRAVEETFVDLARPPDDRSDEHTITISDGGDGSYTLDGPLRTGKPTSTLHLLASLITSVSRLALDEDSANLHLHCAAVARDDRCAVISAPSGTGKTTLAAALLLDGWTYLSDETVSIVPPPAKHVAAFAKPLLLKPGGDPVLPEIRKACVVADGPQEQWWVVPASSIEAKVIDAAVPHVVVILQQNEQGALDQPSSVTELHPADAVVAMMTQTMDADRYGPDAIVALSHLAANCNCVRMTVGTLPSEVAVLNDVIRLPDSTLSVRVLAPPNALSSQPWKLNAGTVSVQIGERIVVHRSPSGAVAALDESASAVWLALHDVPPAWWHPDAMESAATRTFLQQLRQLDLIVSADQKGSS